MTAYDKRIYDKLESLRLRMKIGTAYPIDRRGDNNWHRADIEAWMSFIQHGHGIPELASWMEYANYIWRHLK